MCRMRLSLEDEMRPLNKGEEIVYLQPNRQLELLSYPVSVGIHRNASKRDVLDFIEKHWVKIDSQLRQSYDEKAMRARQRKHDQKLLDFIWENRNLSSTEIKKKLDKQFPKNGLVYYEINQIVRQEKKRRLEDIV
jgi:hypothetical protein